VIDAINAGRIPPAFQEDLQARANELVNTVNCPPTSDEDDDDGKRKKDKKKKDEEEPPPEETIPTEPLPTVTEGDE
jgi:hypothetical protein